MTCVQAAIEAMRREPEQFACTDGDVRRALVRRFPYAVFYVVESEGIVVIAVYHSSRVPSALRSRGKR